MDGRSADAEPAPSATGRKCGRQRRFIRLASRRTNAIYRRRLGLAFFAHRPVHCRLAPVGSVFGVDDGPVTRSRGETKKRGR